MANYMAEVAKLLGVELGAEFEVKECQDIKCTIYNDGLYVYPVKDDLCSLPSSEQVLSRLLEGVITIKCNPFKPKIEKTYWYVRVDGTVTSCRWFEDQLDAYHYKLGNCYRTKDEAEANRDKWLAFYASDEVLEV